MKKILLLSLLLLLPSKVYAQTPNWTLQYSYVNALPSEVGTYTQTVVVDTTNIPTSPTCVAKGTTDTSCSVSLGTLTTGPHAITVTASKAGIDSATTLNINTSNAPKIQTNIKIIQTTTVTIP